MGFFDKLKELGGNIMKEAESALSRVTDKGTLTRVVQASYLVAMADGTFQDEEKVTLGKVIHRKLPHFKNSEISKEIDAAIDICALSAVAGKLELRDSISKAAGTDAAKVVMLSVLAVANADNEFAPSEQQVAREICQWLGLSARDYGL